MPERKIYLEEVDPQSFFGINNKLIDRIRSYFPKIKVVARGSELICKGEEEELNLFEEGINSLLEYYRKYNHLAEEDVERLLMDPEHREKSRNGDFDEVLVYGTSGKAIKARTTNQLRLVQEYRRNDLLIAEGPAGTGKTYTAIALAVRAFKNREIKRIILTRPAVEAGEHLGFLPGDLKEKLDPYLQPLYDALHDMIPHKKLDSMLEDGTVQIAPLAFMRGRTLENAFVILDEAQNATINQLKMFLTRMGASSKFIMTGDNSQIDLHKKQQSGLVQAIRILDNIEGIAHIRFDERDIVRHKLVKDIVRAYDAEEKQGLGTRDWGLGTRD